MSDDSLYVLTLWVSKQTQGPYSSLDDAYEAVDRVSPKEQWSIWRMDGSTRVGSGEDFANGIGPRRSPGDSGSEPLG